MGRRSSRMSAAQRGTTRYRYGPAVLPQNALNDPTFDFVADIERMNSVLDAAGYHPSRGLRAYPAFDEVEDGRQWNPDRRPRTVTGNRVWIGIAPGKGGIVRRPGYYLHSRPWIARDYYSGAPRGIQLPWGVKYEGMFPVLTCVRRKIRRGVMFAKRKVGLGAKRKFRHRNERSKVGC